MRPLLPTAKHDPDPRPYTCLPILRWRINQSSGCRKWPVIECCGSVATRTQGPVCQPLPAIALVVLAACFVLK